MTESKKYILVTFCVAGLVLMLLPVLNVYIDSARVLTRDLEMAYKGRDPNISFLRMTHLLNGSERFDGIVFGSSRTRYGIDADHAERLFGGRWYKAEYPGGTQREHLHNLKLLIEHDRAPRHIIVMLDDFVLFRQINTDSDYFYRLYPDSVFDWLDFYRFYLFKRPSENDWKMAFGGTPLQPYRRILYERQGGRPAASPEAKKDPNVIAVRPRPLRVLSAEPFGWERKAKQDRMDSVLQELAQLRDMCAENQIKMTLVITPRHYKTLFAKDIHILTAFRLELANIHPYFDFSPLSEASMDNQNWREASHFFSGLGNIVLNEVASVEVRGQAVENYVTEQTAALHVQSMKKGMRQNLIGLLRQDPRMFPHPIYLSAEPVARYKVTNSGTINVAEHDIRSQDARVLKAAIKPRKGVRLKIVAHLRDQEGGETRRTIYDFEMSDTLPEVWAALPDLDQGALTRLTFDVGGRKRLINHVELYGLADLQTN